METGRGDRELVARMPVKQFNNQDPKGFLWAMLFERGRGGGRTSVNVVRLNTCEAFVGDGFGVTISTINTWSY